MVKYLASKGADVNVQGENGWTAIHLIVRHLLEKPDKISQAITIIKYLVDEKNADLTIKDEANNETALKMLEYHVVDSIKNKKLARTLKRLLKPKTMK